MWCFQLSVVVSSSRAPPAIGGGPGPRRGAVCRANKQKRHRERYLLTNAIKVTVSVLYWYEELPVQLEIFGEDLRIFFYAFFVLNHNDQTPPRGVLREKL